MQDKLEKKYIFGLVAVIVLALIFHISNNSWFSFNTSNQVAQVSGSLSSGLISYFSFDEGSGSNAVDQSVNGNTGTLVNGTSWINGRIGNGAISLDGINDYVRVGNPANGSLNLGTGDFSVSLWLKGGTWQNALEMLISKGGSGATLSSAGYRVLLQSSGSYLRFETNDGTNRVSKLYGYNYFDGNWHHIVISWNRTSEPIVYVDGLVNSCDSNCTGTPYSSLGNLSNSDNFTIGSRSDGGGGYFSGQIDDVRIYNRAITSQEVSDLFNNIIYSTTPSPTPTPSLTPTPTPLIPTVTPLIPTVTPTPTPTPTPSLDNVPPTVSSVQSSSVLSRSATISWLTNELADSQVEYGISSLYGITSTQKSLLVNTHSETLLNLLPDTTYHYRVKSRDSTGNSSASIDYTFKTAKEFAIKLSELTDTRGIIVEAEQGQLIAPFVAQDGYIVSSVRTTDPAVSGSATFDFDITESDNYRVELYLDASFDFDMFASMDGVTPTRSYFIGETQRTVGFEWRSVYWTQTNGSNMLNLSPGRHRLVIYGGTANVKIDKVRLIKMVDRFTMEPAPVNVISNSIAVMNSALDLLDQDRVGCSLPSSYYVCGVRAGLTKYDMVVKLPVVLDAGRYYVFVKGTSPGGLTVSIGSQATALVLPNSSDTNGDWTSFGSIDVISNQHYAVITTYRKGDITKNEISLMYGLYITKDPNESLSSSDVVINSQPSTPASSTASVGNLLSNSGFEVGVLGDWVLPSRTGTMAQRIYSVVPFTDFWDQTVSYEGNSSLKIPVNRISLTKREVYQPVYSKPFYLKNSQTYTLSFWAKTNLANTVGVDFGFENISDTTKKVEKRITVNGTWQRYSITGDTSAYPSPYYRIKFLVFGGDVSTWIDNIQFQEGDLTDYVPSQPIEAGFNISTAGHVFYEDEPIVATLHVHNVSSQNRDDIIQYEIYNYKNQIVKRDSTSISLNAGQHTTRQINIDPGIRGAFRILYWVVGQNDSDKEILYSVVPRPVLFNPDLSYMGIHLNVADYQFDLAKKLGITWSRSLSTADFFRWTFVEIQDDVYVWPFDDKVQQMKNSGMGFLANLNVPSPLQDWANDGTGNPDLDKWADYVRTTVAHYKQWVNYWEIENEPNHSWPASHYARMLKVAVDTIESVDPNAKIVAMGGTSYSYMHEVVANLESLYPSWNWKDHIDIFSTHAYPGGTPSEVAITEIVSKYGVQVWNTETGVWDMGSFVGPYSRYASAGTQLYPFKDADVYYRGWLKKPEALVQNFILSIGGGQTKYFYYDSRVTSQPFSTQPTLLDTDDSVTAKGVAYAIAGHFIDYSTSLGSLALDTNIHAYLFERSAVPILAIWTKNLTNKNLRTNLLSSQYTVYDLMGNEISTASGNIPIGRTPVYVQGNNISTDLFKTAILNGTLSSRLDTNAPNVAISIAPRGNINNNRVKISYFAIDESSLPEIGDLDPEQTTPSPGMNPNALLYSHRLVGHNSNWSSWTAESNVEYSTLNDGLYTFEVKAKDETGNISSVASREFQIGENSLVNSPDQPLAPVNPPDVENPDLPVPVNGLCGQELNICTQGVLDDIEDTSSYLLWNCVGLNNGTTARCSVANNSSVPTPSPTLTPTPTPTVTSAPAPAISGGSGGGGGGGSVAGGGNSGGLVLNLPSSRVYFSGNNNEAKVVVYPTIKNNLYRNSTVTSDIKIVQTILNSEGLLPTSSISLQYDLITEKAVAQYQKKYNIVSSGTALTTGLGVVGPKTRVSMNKNLELGKYPSLGVVQVVQNVASSISTTTALTNSRLPKDFKFTTTLKLGSTGIDVKNLQIFLNDNGYTVSTTGIGSKGQESTYFGPATQKALIRYQEANAKDILTPSGLIKGTGYFGPATMRKVNGGSVM